jgi:hypothetical protein
MASSPASTGPSSGSRIGRPPQWTISRSRKLARLYLYSTLSIEKILRVLEEDGFNPRWVSNVDRHRRPTRLTSSRKNSAQKTIHKMLDNDPRYLRPESRIEMSKRIHSLSMSPSRRKRKGLASRRMSPIHGTLEVQSSSPHLSGRGANNNQGESMPHSEVTSPSGQSTLTEDAPSFDFAFSPDVSNISYFSAPFGSLDPAEPSNVTSLDMVHEIKRRISDCSTHHAAQLCTVIKDFTISTPSDDQTTGRRPSLALSEGSEPEESPGDDFPPEPYEAFPDPSFALPGDFLTAHTRSCADFPGQQHGNGDCWCSIAKETSAAPDSWLLPTGQLSERARHVLEHPSPNNINMRDSFGNTALHLFAALEGYRETLFAMVVNADKASLMAVNTAGQGFLHVLNLEWFANFSTPSAPLEQLLAHIRDFCPELAYQADVYGRTFFHRAQSLVRDPSLLGSLISFFNPTLASRDAFGFDPVSDVEGPYIPPRRMGSQSLLGDYVAGSPTSQPPSSSEDSFLAYHARLVQIIQSSYTDPTIEDAEGRNGLHCLAEAILNQQTMDRHVRSSSSSSSTSSRPHLKRKLDTSKEAPTSNPSSPGPTSSPAPPAEGTLPTRLRHLHSLLHPSVSVSVSHYDRRGYTPLMAFIEHIPDDQDDKAKTLQTILETLIRAGAGIEARNRRGETPLLVAARLGRKVALTTLLELGANVYARDVDGRGVLEVIDAEVTGGRARAEVGLYARLEACRVLLTGRREWGVRYVGGKRGDGEGAVVREWMAVGREGV